MLKGIDPLIGPQLLYTLASMGHGDRLALVDRNYPAYASGKPVHHLAGVGIIAAGRAIFSLLPLDSFVEYPVERMEVVGTPDEVTKSQREFCELLSEISGRTVQMSSSTREAFYIHAREASAVVATGEVQPYSCFIVRKGTVPETLPGSLPVRNDTLI